MIDKLLYIVTAKLKVVDARELVALLERCVKDLHNAVSWGACCAPRATAPAESSRAQLKATDISLMGDKMCMYVCVCVRIATDISLMWM